MAHGTPFTEGKHYARQQGGKPGGPFKEGTGGHTSRGVEIKANAKHASTSNENTRIGKLKLRKHGAGATQGYPK